MRPSSASRAVIRRRGSRTEAADSVPQDPSLKPHGSHAWLFQPLVRSTAEGEPRHGRAPSCACVVRGCLRHCRAAILSGCLELSIQILLASVGSDGLHPTMR